MYVQRTDKVKSEHNIMRYFVLNWLEDVKPCSNNENMNNL